MDGLHVLTHINPAHDFRTASLVSVAGTVVTVSISLSNLLSLNLTTIPRVSRISPTFDQGKLFGLRVRALCCC